jgi:hypothetical protein
MRDVWLFSDREWTWPPDFSGVTVGNAGVTVEGIRVLTQGSELTILSIMQDYPAIDLPA